MDTIRPTKQNVELNNLPIHLKGVKVVVECTVCGNSWSVYTEDETAFLNNLSPAWWKCSVCNRQHATEVRRG
jgi:hypothetical protein